MDLFCVKIDDKTINISNYLKATNWKMIGRYKKHIGSYGDIKLILLLNAQDN